MMHQDDRGSVHDDGSSSNEDDDDELSEIRVSLSDYDDSDSELDELDQFPVASSGCTLTPLGSNLIVVGGWNPRHEDTLDFSNDRGYVRKVYKYNMYSGIWSEHVAYRDETNSPIETACHAMFPLTANRLLFLGGSLSPLAIDGSSNKIYIYSMTTETWEQLRCEGGEENVPAIHIGHWWGRAAFLHGNTLTVCTGNFITNRMEINQLHMETLPYRWEKIKSVDKSTFPFPMVKHQIIVYDEKLYVFGGAPDISVTTRYEDFNGSLLSLPTFDLREKKWYYTQCTFDGDDSDDRFNRCNIWPFASTVILRGHHAFLAGGHSHDASTPITLLTNVLCLDLVEKKWTDFGKLAGRFFHASCLASDGGLYVYGGCTTADYNGGRSNELLCLQCAVPSLYRCALRALFTDGFRGELKEKLRTNNNALNETIDHLRSIGYPDYAIRELF